MRPTAASSARSTRPAYATYLHAIRASASPCVHETMPRSKREMRSLALTQIRSHSVMRTVRPGGWIVTPQRHKDSECFNHRGAVALRSRAHVADHNARRAFGLGVSVPPWFVRTAALRQSRLTPRSAESRSQKSIEPIIIQRLVRPSAVRIVVRCAATFEGSLAASRSNPARSASSRSRPLGVRAA